MILIALAVKALAGIIGLFLAAKYVPNVSVLGGWPTYLGAGIILGIINTIFKPVVDIITIPLKILTLGLLGLLINIGIVWLLDLVLPIDFVGIKSLFISTIIIFTLNELANAIIKT